MDPACKLERDTETLTKNGVNKDRDTNPLLSDSDSGTHSLVENWIPFRLSSLVNQMISAANKQLGRANAINTAIDTFASAALGLVGNFQSPAGGDEVRSIAPTPATLASPNATQSRLCSMLDVAQRTSQVDQPNSNNDADTERRPSTAFLIPQISNQISTSPSRSPHVHAAENQTLEEDVFPVCQGGEQSAGNENVLSPAFGKDPELGEMHRGPTESFHLSAWGDAERNT